MPPKLTLTMTYLLGKTFICVLVVVVCMCVSLHMYVQVMCT